MTVMFMILQVIKINTSNCCIILIYFYIYIYMIAYIKPDKNYIIIQLCLSCLYTIPS